MRDSQIRYLLKTVAASGTPEALGTSAIKFSDIKFVGENAFGVPNTGNVFLQVQDAAGTWTDTRTIAPGDTVSYVSPNRTCYRASEFRIRVATNGDGVRCEYSI